MNNEERNTPEKPIRIGLYYNSSIGLEYNVDGCPNCTFKLQRDNNHCPRCGQMIDWS